MTSVTLWILISVAGTYRPTTVIERFHSKFDCEKAMAQLDAVQPLKLGACIPVEAAR